MSDSASDNQAQVMQLIQRAHDELVAFARKSYQIDGRGVILIDVPAFAPGPTC